MPVAIDVTAGTYSTGASSLTTGSVSPGGADRYVFGISAVTGQTNSAFRYGGPGGTDLDDESTDESVFFGVANMRLWSALPGPSGSTTFYGSFSGSGACSILAATLTGVDQLTPHGGWQEGADSQWSGDAAIPVAHTVTGVTAGQKCYVAVCINNAGDRLIDSIVEDVGTTIEGSVAIPASTGSQMNTLLLLSGDAVGSSLSLGVTVNCTGGGFIGWKTFGAGFNEAAGGASFQAAWARGSNQLIEA